MGAPGRWRDHLLCPSLQPRLQATDYYYWQSMGAANSTLLPFSSYTTNKDIIQHIYNIQSFTIHEHVLGTYHNTLHTTSGVQKNWKLLPFSTTKNI